MGYNWTVNEKCFSSLDRPFTQLHTHYIYIYKKNGFKWINVHAYKKSIECYLNYHENY